MVFSIILLALIAAIAYFQAIQGLFSAFLMSVVAVISAAVAFSFYELLAVKVFVSWKPDYAQGISLVLIFVVALILLRVAFDKLISRAPLLHAVLDKVGGLVFGLVTGLTLAGVLAIAVQMLPWEKDFLGFERFTKEGERNSLWLKPDEFTLKLVSMLSEQTLDVGRPVHETHPDLLKALHNARVGLRHSVHVVPPDSVAVVDIVDVPVMYNKTQGTLRRPSEYSAVVKEPGDKYIGVHVRVQGDAGDEDHYHRFYPAQVRIVGRGTGQSVGASYTLYGIQDNEQQDKYITLTEDQLWGTTSGELTFVFKTPQNFRPWFVEYKVLGRAEIRGAPVPANASEQRNETAGAPPTGGADAAAAAPSGSTSGGGRVSGVNYIKGGSEFSDRLPFPVSKYLSVEAEVNTRNGALQQGVLYGDMIDQQESANAVTSLEVPEGKVLFQMDVNVLHPGSTLGQVLNFAVTTVKNYSLTDSNGNQYFIAGAIALAKLQREDVFEIQYFPELAEMNKAIRPFQRLKDRDFTGEYMLRYLFLVKPGAELVTFDTGRKKTDLSRERFIAPGS